MDEIFSSTDVKHLPQALLSLKTVNGKSYSSIGSSTPYIQFEIPGSLGYVASEEITLDFDFQYTDSTGQVRKVCPAECGGLGNMIHQIDIYSIADGVLLESIQDYETLNSIWVSSGVGGNDQVESGKAKVMSVTESYVRDDQEVCPYWTPNADPNVPLTLLPRSYQKQKICLPLRHSAILNGSQVVPVGALGGVRVNITCNPVGLFTNVRLPDMLKKSELFEFSIENSGGEIIAGNRRMTIVITGATAGNGTYNYDFNVGDIFKTQTELFDAITTGLADIATQAAASNIVFTLVRVPGQIENKFICEVSGSAPNTEAQFQGSFITGTPRCFFPVVSANDLKAVVGGQNADLNGDAGRLTNVGYLYFGIGFKHSAFGLNDVRDLNTCPFVVGQKLTYTQAPGNNVTTSDIVTIEAHTNNANVTYLMATLTDGLTNDDIDGMVEGDGAFHSENNWAGLEYSLTNVSLTVPVVSVPPSYSVALTKAIQSAEGLKMNIRTFQLQRGNTMNGESQATILIPSVQTKVKGVLSIPYKASSGSPSELNLANNCFEPHISSYYYQYFGVRNPEQGVDIEKLAVAKRVPAELLFEQDKAYSTCFEEGLKTYQGYDTTAGVECFQNRSWFLGRSLAQFNGFMDSRFSNLQLIVFATSSAGAMAGNWNWDNHLSVIHTLNIKSDGVTLMI